MMQVRYETQRLSERFFVLMLVLFLFQVGFGLILAVQQVDPAFLKGVLNFNIARAEHVNLAVMWSLCGFIGLILYAGPLLAGRELASPWMAKFLFWALVAVVLWNASTLSLAQAGLNRWWAGQPLFQEGLEYIEGGRVTDILILVGFLILVTIVFRTLPRPKTWNEIHWGLALGVAALTVMWVFGMFFVPRVDLQEYFRWFVVHYWVEGVWEVLHITLVGFLLMRMFGASLRSVGFAIFWGIAMVWLSGLLGNAHHYFWIGTPEFWQFWGSLFSALEPLPMIFCFWHVYLDAHHDQRPLQNTPAFYFILGSVVLEQVGAGILGFTQTFALTNVWMHGTWVTPAHGHLALFGTFGMLGIAGAYFALPALRGRPDFDQRFGVLGFWLLFTGMVGMAIAYALGGTVQIYVYRILGLDWFGGEVRPAMALYKAMLPLFGTVFTIGAGLTAFDLFTLGRRVRQVHPHALAGESETHPAAPGTAAAGDPSPIHPIGPWFGRPISRFELGTWLGILWLFGIVITLGLLSFNLESVRAGDPTLPYLLSAVGYPGLMLATVLFVARFQAAMEARRTRVAGPPPPVAAWAPAAPPSGPGAERGI